MLFAVIRRLTSIGIAVLYVSHKLEEIFEIADTVTVLRDGRHISTRPIGEHTNDSLIQDMIGRRIENLFPRSRGTARDDVILKVEDLSTDTKLANVSFEAKAGEVLGFFGLMGAGRPESPSDRCRLDPIRRAYRIGGAPLSPHNTSARRSASGPPRTARTKASCSSFRCCTTPALLRSRTSRRVASSTRARSEARFRLSSIVFV
jgi:ABC-type sugar transport system ATPase subunit